jgi:galactose mutarotase-like enzyme
VLELSSADLRVVLRPERGAELAFVGPPGDNRLAWYDWLTPLRASRSASYGSSELDFLSEYRGGWQVLFPNAGPESEIRGLPVPFHGEAAGAEWEVVDADAAGARLRVPSRLPLVLERTVRVEGRSLLVEEVVTNESDEEWTFGWGHHPAFDAPPGTRIDMPDGPLLADAAWDSPLVDTLPGAEGRWPLIDGKQGTLDYSEIGDGVRERLCYRPNLPGGWAALRHPATGRGTALAWDVDVFPHAWLWQQMGGPGLPFFGRARLAAIEPVNLWPADGIAAATARGQGRRIEARGEVRAWITVSLFDATDAPVVGVDRSGRVETGEPA